MKSHVVWFTLALTALVIQLAAWPVLATRPGQASADTAQPFALVKDSNVDPHSVSSLGGTTVFGTVNNRLLFSAFIPQTGDELCSTDSTPDRFVFDADDGTHGKELWETNGTPTNTTLLKDANPNGGSGPTFLGTMANPTGIAPAFYAMNDGTNGAEPWVTDGTAAGTIMLANIYPRNGSNPSSMVTVGNLNFFAATSAEGGRELWKTDGTLAGTMQVADIPSGATGSDPQSLTVFNNALYFTADDHIHGRELWRTDGITTTLLRDLLPGDAGGAWSIMGVAQGALLFAADDGTTGVELWKTNGTPEGTTQVKKHCARHRWDLS